MIEGPKSFAGHGDQCRGELRGVIGGLRSDDAKALNAAFGNVIQAPSAYGPTLRYNSYKLLNLYRFKALPSPKGVDLPAKRRGPAKAKRVTKDKEKARSLDGKGLGNLDGKALGNLDGKGLPNHYQQGASPFPAPA